MIPNDFRVYTRSNDPNKEVYSSYTKASDFVKHISSLIHSYGQDAFKNYDFIITLDGLTIKLTPEKWQLMHMFDISMTVKNQE